MMTWLDSVVIQIGWPGALGIGKDSRVVDVALEWPDGYRMPSTLLTQLNGRSFDWLPAQANVEQ